MTIDQLPSLNAALNTCAAVCLSVGYVMIRRGRREAHRRWMLGAVAFSAAFLTTYLIYHANHPSTPYPYHDWTRPLYFAILVPHIILAALMVPGILTILWLAWRRRFERHRAIARWVWPVWMFVSVSGVAVYWMLYRL